MKTRTQTDIWISCSIVVLGCMLTLSTVGCITMLSTGRSMPGLLVALGTVAVAGLVQLSISPLNQDLSQ